MIIIITIIIVVIITNIIIIIIVIIIADVAGVSAAADLYTIIHYRAIIQYHIIF